MIRYEVRSPSTSRLIVGDESTMEQAVAYVAAMVEAGVEVTDVQYYDRDARIAQLLADHAARI